MDLQQAQTEYTLRAIRAQARQSVKPCEICWNTFWILIRRSVMWTLQSLWPQHLHKTYSTRKSILPIG